MLQSTISGEIFKQTAFGMSVYIPLALFFGVRAKKHGVIGTMINGNPEAVWAQRKDPLTQLWDVLYNLAAFTLLTVQSHCDISVLRPLLMPPLPFVLCGKLSFPSLLGKLLLTLQDSP